MPTKKNSFDAIKRAAEQITQMRAKDFVNALEGQLPSTNNKIRRHILKASPTSATTIDGWLQSAESDSRLEGIALNRVAFKVWKRLHELGVEITDHDKCRNIPDPKIESKLSRAVERDFTKDK